MAFTSNVAHGSRQTRTSNGLEVMVFMTSCYSENGLYSQKSINNSILSVDTTIGYQFSVIAALAHAHP